MASGGVFINYRGEDCGPYGALLYAELSHRFGADQVFRDSESIAAGADYATNLLARVRQARVVLAVIGPRWLTAARPDGRRRIDDPADWVRRELTEALAAGVRIIPVLTDRADIPLGASLPADIAPLARLQFRHLRHRDAGTDIDRLAQELGTLLGASSAAAAPSPASPPILPTPHQLPATTRHFTGRQAQLHLLLRPAPEATPGATDIRIVSGMAGAGKTALVLHAAHRLAAGGEWPDGVLFLDMRAHGAPTATDPAAALEAVLRALGLTERQLPTGTDARAALYRSLAARQRFLIVLDDARDENHVRPLLPGTATCRVLITSRRRLTGLDDAVHLTLGSLPLPDAVRLFQALVPPGLDSGPPLIARDVVQLCGLLPLAIRIASAHLASVPGHDTLTLLRLLRAARDAEEAPGPGSSDRLEVLDDGERSVLAALEVSVRELSAEQQRAFGSLGLHPGPTLEPDAAAALLDTTPAAAGRLLAALARVSLLDQPTPGRYRYHDLVKAYATSRCRPPEAEARRLLCHLYAHCARSTSAAVALAYPAYQQRTSPLPGGPDLAGPAAATAWLDAELPSLLATVHHAASTAAGPAERAHVTSQSAALYQHLRVRGATHDAEALHRAAVALGSAASDRRAELGSLNRLGWTYHVQGRPAEAARCFTRATDLARAVHDPAAERAVLTGLGHVHHEQGRHPVAARCLLRAAELGHASDAGVAEAEIMIGLGYVHHPQGRYAEALACYSRAIELARAGGHAMAEVDALIGLAWTHAAQGRHRPAATYLLRSLRLARTTGNQVGEAGAMNGLGFLHLTRRRYRPARACQIRTLRLSRATGYLVGELAALAAIGSLHLATGRHQPARACYQRVLDLATEAGIPNWQLEAQLGLGRADHAAGDPDRALTRARHALDIARAIGQRPDQARVLDCLASASHILGRSADAFSLWQQALDVLDGLGAPAAEDVSAARLRARLAGAPGPAPHPLISPSRPRVSKHPVSNARWSLPGSDLWS